MNGMANNRNSRNQNGYNERNHNRNSSKKRGKKKSGGLKIALGVLLGAVIGIAAGFAIAFLILFLSNRTGLSGGDAENPGVSSPSASADSDAQDAAGEDTANEEGSVQTENPVVEDLDIDLDTITLHPIAVLADETQFLTGEDAQITITLRIDGSYMSDGDSLCLDDENGSPVVEIAYENLEDEDGVLVGQSQISIDTSEPKVLHYTAYCGEYESEELSIYVSEPVTEDMVLYASDVLSELGEYVNEQYPDETASIEDGEYPDTDTVTEMLNNVDEWLKARDDIYETRIMENEIFFLTADHVTCSYSPLPVGYDGSLGFGTVSNDENTANEAAKSTSIENTGSAGDTDNTGSAGKTGYTTDTENTDAAVSNDFQSDSITYLSSGSGGRGDAESEAEEKAEQEAKQLRTFRQYTDLTAYYEADDAYKESLEPGFGYFFGADAPADPNVLLLRPLYSSGKGAADTSFSHYDDLAKSIAECTEGEVNDKKNGDVLTAFITRELCDYGTIIYGSHGATLWVDNKTREEQIYFFFLFSGRTSALYDILGAWQSVTEKDICNYFYSHSLSDDDVKYIRMMLADDEKEGNDSNTILASSNWFKAFYSDRMFNNTIFYNGSCYFFNDSSFVRWLNAHGAIAVSGYYNASNEGFEKSYSKQYLSGLVATDESESNHTRRVIDVAEETWPSFFRQVERFEFVKWEAIFGGFVDWARQGKGIDDYVFYSSMTNGDFCYKGTGTLNGIVAVPTEDGGYIGKGNMTVTAHRLNGRTFVQEGETVTDDDGNFSFNDLRWGYYVMEVSGDSIDTVTASVIFDENSNDGGIIYVEEKEELTVRSAPIGAWDGTTYILPGYTIAGLTQLPIEPVSGDYIASFAHYDDKIVYSSKDAGTSDYYMYLVVCNEDGSDARIIASGLVEESPYSYTNFAIQEGVIYCSSYSRKEYYAVDLNTGEVISNPEVPQEAQNCLSDESYLYTEDQVYYQKNGSGGLLEDEIHVIDSDGNDTTLIRVDGGIEVDAVVGNILYYSYFQSGGSSMYLASYDLTTRSSTILDSHPGAGGGMYFNW